jgi:c-di-GMP-binding flagellar brake protein YcgR
MEDKTTESLVQRIQRRLNIFFPEEIFTAAMIEEALEDGEIFFKPTDMLPYLQTVLMDEKILEVELDGLTRVYFSRLYDDLPPLQEVDDSGTSTTVNPDYSAGDYLKRMSHLIALPLEPGIGNLFIRHSQRVLLRFFTTTYAVELGTVFQDLADVRGLPVLRLAYPAIGRLVRGAREFRAKVPETMKLIILIMGKRKHGTIRTRVVDMSASGMAFSITKEQQELFRIDETRTIEFVHDDMMMVRLNGKIRHVSKVRGKKGTEFICGIQFDLATRAIAAKIESIVAMVQRAHLKELSDLSAESGMKFII